MITSYTYEIWFKPRPTSIKIANFYPLLQFNMGSPVPESYYFSCNKPVPTSDMVKAVIPSSNKLKLKFEITSPVILK